MKKLIIGLISIILAALIGVTAFIYWNLSKIQKDTSVGEHVVLTDSNGNPITEDEKLLREKSIPTSTNGLGIIKEEKDKINKYSNKNVKNILIMGIDSESGNGRSDAIMILTVDGAHKKIKMSSLQRDSYVYVPGNGMTKLNHAYAYGGPQLSIRTVNTNFGMDIEDYASVNFSSLPKIIDRLDGVDIYLSSAEASEIGAGSSEGEYHLSGEQALSYSRIRRLDTDYQRTSRQRTVLESLFKKMMATSPTEYPSMINDIAPLVRTSLSSSEILSMGVTVATDKYTIAQSMFPNEEYAHGEIIDGLWYFIYDKDKVINRLHKFIYEQ